MPGGAAGPNTCYRACLENLDGQIGRLRSAANERTLFFVMGDNGTAADPFELDSEERRYPLGHPLHRSRDHRTRVRLAPYRLGRQKKTPYEGGLRVPLILSGPAVSDPGRTSDALVDAVDVFTTIAALAGAALPETEIDGLDFSPLLSPLVSAEDEAGPRRSSFSEYFTPNGVGPPSTRKTQFRSFIREDGPYRWKLIHRISNESGDTGESYEFYRLKGPDGADPLELDDLGRGHPEFAATKLGYEALVGER